MTAYVVINMQKAQGKTPVLQLLHKKRTGCDNSSSKTFQSRQFSHLPHPMHSGGFVTQADFFFFSLQVINEYRNFACRTLAWGCIQAHSLHKSTLVSPSRTVKLPGGYECLPATIHSSKASINSRLTLSKSMTDIVFNTVLLTPGEKENTWLSTSLIKHTCWIHQTTVAAQPASRWDKAEVAS